MTQALAVQQGQQLQQQARQSPKILEVMQYAEIFAGSGMFTDIKTANQAAVKIMAGETYGFDAITSMAYVHFIQGKAYLGAKLLSAMIKSSGKYNYKVVTHTDKECVVQFMQMFNDEWKPLGIPVSYTIQEATNAGLMGKDTWKKYPKAMLFANCIRTGFTRYTTDLLKTDSTPTPYPEMSRMVETANVPELQGINAHDEIEVEAIPATLVDDSTEPINAEESIRADLETAVMDLLKEKSQGNPAKVKSMMKGREVAQMNNDELSAMLTEWETV